MTPGESVTYNAIDCIPDEDSADAGHYTPEFLNTLSPNGLPPFQLKLKVGQPIILLRNMNPAQGLCNGTRLTIKHLGRRLIGAEIMVGVNRGYHVLIPRIPLTNSDDDLAFPIKFRRTQFPIKPAYAITINKAQGQTLQQVGLYLPQPVFGHGQLYVALSRCTTPHNLKILIENGDIEGMQGVYTRNVVYKRLLSD
jgi:ATP-dependent DNA helicase PIF1